MTVAPALSAALQEHRRPAEDADSLLRRLDWQVIRRLDGLLQGDYRSLFTGQGYDLAEVREYQSQDDVRYMDWNVTARMDTPYVRQYIEEREITAWLLLDLSPSVDFGTADARKRDLVVDFAGVISRLLMRHGNKVGAMMFSEGVDEVLPPRNGQMHALRLLHQLVRSDQRTPGRGHVTDLGAILDRAARTLRRRTLVFVVSDFISESDWEPALGRLSLDHELLAVWLTDPREEEIPDVGPIVLEDAESGEQVYVDTGDRGFQERFRQLVVERRMRIERSFSRHGVDVLRLSTGGNMAREIARFAQLRRESQRRFRGKVGAGR
jgi:uncharacterized protein (DUF58 family)